MVSLDRSMATLPRQSTPSQSNRNKSVSASSLCRISTLAALGIDMDFTVAACCAKYDPIVALSHKPRVLPPGTLVHGPSEILGRIRPSTDRGNGLVVLIFTWIL
jgi:hypothetical protein